jgi:adenosylcobinamide kinase / adenosylcobinamide-phosphate guanylyltransferase
MTDNNMGKIIFITGGARSGKSSFAESLLAGKDKVLYVATGIGFDDEMKDRIARHRSQRNPAWKTVECYRDIVLNLGMDLPSCDHILLDCVTIMVSNFMVLDAGVDWDSAGMEAIDAIEGIIRGEITAFIEMAKGFRGETLIVSNEVGMGIVPPAPLGRYYRDIAGKMNQMIARTADEVYFLVSGIPMRIK